MKAAICAVLWIIAYCGSEPFARWIAFGLTGFKRGSAFGGALEFFIYDAAKILLLLAALVYIIAWLRSSLNVERLRASLAGKRRGVGYFLAALLGAVTPFCSCSSIPLFLGFTTAGLPFGAAMAFLITSPLINEIGVVLLWGLLGWKLALVYILAGFCAGILGGFLMDALDAERWLQPFALEKARQARASGSPETDVTGLYQRHAFAAAETQSIIRRVWIWVLIGVGIGAGLHGYVPDDWFARHFSAGEWWTVPAAVLAGLPLYSNIAGIVPIMESLLAKGLPIGTTLAFCMSAVAASLPEALLLRQIMGIRLQALFMGYLWIIFTVVGFLLNGIGRWLAN